MNTLRNFLLMLFCYDCIALAGVETENDRIFKNFSNPSSEQYEFEFKFRQEVPHAKQPQILMEVLRRACLDSTPLRYGVVDRVVKCYQLAGVEFAPSTVLTQILKKLYSDSNIDVRLYVFDILYRVRNDDEKDLVLEAFDDKDESVRAAAIATFRGYKNSRTIWQDFIKKYQYQPDYTNSVHLAADLIKFEKTKLSTKIIKQ